MAGISGIYGCSFLQKMLMYGNVQVLAHPHIIMFPERQAIVVDLRQNHVSSDPKWIYGCPTHVCCYPEMPFEMSCFMRYDMSRGQHPSVTGDS